MKLFIAIDDTDNLESVGTGKLARMLADDLTEKALVSQTSVTRHQLLVHPDIPYTSHNSSACIEAVSTDSRFREIAIRSNDFLIENFHEGADPGLCVVEQDAVPEALRQFGDRAQREVIKTDEARELAETFGLFTWWKGEPWRGCIGAMAGVGLRSTRNDGRFIGLKGIRELKGTLRVGEIIGNSEIKRVLDLSFRPLNDQEIVDTQDWVRPSLHNGKPALFVVKHGAIWKPAEEKKGKP
jgi:hypothetical protein